jgi:hypothetical protein
MISQRMSWHLRGGMERAGTLQALHRSGLAIANVLGTGVQLNSECLVPAHVAVDAA